MLAILVSACFVALEPLLFVTTPFWRCELLSLLGFLRSSTLLFGAARRCYGLSAFSFRSLLFGEAKSFAATRLFLGCSVFDRDISHECKAAQPSLVLSVIDIHDLPKLGFVSTSYFLDLLWGRAQLKLKKGTWDRLIKKAHAFLQRLLL
jgi:hypothetical protein